MKNNLKNQIVSSEEVLNRIYVIRGKRVMLDRDLAALYGVETKVLNQAVTRNVERFPSDFMFRISKQDFIDLRSQTVTANHVTISSKSRTLPRVFTEQGVAMLSSVLKSERGIQVNIEIMRAFTQLRNMITNYKDLVLRIDEMEKKYDKNFRMVFDAIRKLIVDKDKPKRKIGF